MKIRSIIRLFRDLFNRLRQSIVLRKYNSFTIAEYLSVIKGALCNRKNGNVSPSDIATVKA